ncbi:acyltransferase family protein [Altererythrobacter aurantiacus]|uniref:Acyltransferase family protein n=1 Tax=Parapontixanthobacter aurantiacus TaxID=1463599 RepID=A0A844ZFJ4_9SPHN|nr:acyltransferase [Parapontixanthobacter aurantiacus]MXO86635.1 acyltransferase family protein [Parapontixanthobacter aurantiacus]
MTNTRSPDTSDMTPATGAAEATDAPKRDMVFPVDGRSARASSHLAILDGWRALCILLVIAGHQLPLNAILPGANDAAGAGGMAIFFTLSGFLITRFLWQRPQVKPFLIRRVLRILPLAYLAMAILYFAEGADRSVSELIANLLFYMNLPPSQLMTGGAHLWSLAVEMQFYVAVALIAALAGKRGLYVLPILALCVTGARIAAGETTSIVTWHRVDEILAGATLALLYLGAFGERAQRLFAKNNFYVLAAFALVCTFFHETPLAYARPYTVAAMVGITLYHAPRWLDRVFSSRPAAYIAKISYALYVFHVMLDHTWLGSGDVTEKYLKRPLLFAATWAAAHLSTFYWEQRFIDLAKRWSTPAKRS